MPAALVAVDVPSSSLADCDACVDRLRDRLAGHDGVVEVADATGVSSLRILIDSERCSRECLSAAAGAARDELEKRYAHDILPVVGMDCADCARGIERAVRRLDGVTAASVSFAAARLRVEHRRDTSVTEGVVREVERLGYSVSARNARASDRARRPSWKTFATLASAALLALALVLDVVIDAGRGALVPYAAAIVIGGMPIARAGLTALRATRWPDINLLMTIAAVGAVAIGAWTEAAFVVVLFSVGQALERRAVERARRELESLVSLTPLTARVLRGNGDHDGAQQAEEVEVAVADLRIDDHVVVRPGERIAADGTVVDGASAVDQAPITGESNPIDKLIGDAVFAGTLNLQGRLVIGVSHAPGDTTLDRIARLVADAQERRAPSERWIDRFAHVYTPIVIAAAVSLAVLAPALGLMDTSRAIYSALALLILACPCALVISTPVALVSALGRASAAGVLVKGGAYLERAAAIDTVAFDKTGTLTLGTPRVQTITPLAGDENTLLGLAASLEQASEHPLAKAIVGAARSRECVISPVSGFEARTGLGASGDVQGARVEIGAARLFSDALLEGAPLLALDQVGALGQTAVLVVREGTPLGVIGLADTARPEAAEAVSQLRRLGIDQIVMLTGDHDAAAAGMAEHTGISDVRAGLLPSDKADALEGLGRNAAMVGDGVNDAPALAAAALGIAMGSAGSDTAIEVADVALLGDDPRKVPGLIGLARWTRAVVRQNIYFSLATKLAAVAVLAAGSLPLWGAVLTDVGASLVVVANSLRLLRMRPLAGSLHAAPLLAAPVRSHDTAPPRSIASRPPLQTAPSNGTIVVRQLLTACGADCCAETPETPPARDTGGPRS